MVSHELTCDCGHSFTSERERDYCAKCGRKVFRDPDEQRKHRFNNYYMGTLIVAVLAFITFIFMEVVAIPILKF
jgi:uncharacterized paraquat-inducible protein A